MYDQMAPTQWHAGLAPEESDSHNLAVIHHHINHVSSVILLLGFSFPTVCLLKRSSMDIEDVPSSMLKSKINAISSMCAIEQNLIIFLFVASHNVSRLDLMLCFGKSRR